MTCWKRARPVTRRSLVGAPIGLLFLTAWLGCLTGCSSSNQLQGQLVAAWRDGDEAFRKTQFDTAIKEYRFIAARLKSQGHAPAVKADHDLADALVALCEALQKADKLIVNNSFSEGNLLLIEKTCARVAELPEAGTTVPTEFQLGGRSAGRAFTPAERAAEVSGWGRQRLESWQSRWDKQATDARQRWEDGERLLKLARRFAASDASWKDVAAEQERIAKGLEAQEKLRELQAAIQTCLQTPSRDSYEAARSLREAVAAGATPELGLEAIWDAFRAELPPALRAATRPEDKARTASRVISKTLDRLALDAACAMNRELLDLPEDASSPLVFVMAADRCYALEANSGRPRWALRVGFSTRGLPIMIQGEGRSLVALAWSDGKSLHVSVVQAADGEPLWTASLPEGAELMGPLVSAGGGLYAALDRGQLWRFEPGTGAIQGVLKFPEPFAGPLVADSDARRAIVLGRDMAIYVVPLELPLRVESVHLLDEDTRYEDTHGLWASPYIVLVRNTTAGRAEVHVLGEPTKAGGGQRLQRHEIAGRVWQPPVLHANQLLLSTDGGDEIVLGMDVNQPQSPIYELHHRGGGPAGSDVAHPICAVHPDGGFLVLRRGGFEAWALDILNRAGVRRNSLWQCPLEAAEIPSQPLQAAAGRVFTVTQRPGKTGSRIRSVDPANGAVDWLRTMGLNASEIVFQRQSTQGKCMALVWTSGDTWRLFEAASAGAIAGRTLDWGAANGTLEWAPHSRKIAWLESQPRPRLMIGRATSGGVDAERSWPVDNVAASPLAAYEGRLGVNAVAPATADAAPENVWIAGIDAGRRLLLAQSQAADRAPQFQNLPAHLPDADWYRPTWFDGGGIVAGHPRGHLLSATVEAIGRLPFLGHAASTVVSEHGLMGPPVRVGKHVWALDRAGTILVREWPSLAATAQTEVGAPATPLVVAGQRVFVGLRDGAVVGTPVEAGLPGRAARIVVGKQPISQLAWEDEGKRLIAVDLRGDVFWIRPGGVVQRVGTVSSGASVPPLIWHDTVHVLTEGGTIESISLLNAP